MKKLRRELLARRDEDQRIRTMAPPPGGQYMVQLPGEVAAQWQRIDEENTRWLGEVLNAPGLAGADAGRLGRRRCGVAAGPAR